LRGYLIKKSTIGRTFSFSLPLSLVVVVVVVVTVVIILVPPRRPSFFHLEECLVCYSTYLHFPSHHRPVAHNSEYRKRATTPSLSLPALASTRFADVDLEFFCPIITPDHTRVSTPQNHSPQSLVTTVFRLGKDYFLADWQLGRPTLDLKVRGSTHPGQL